MSDLQAIADRVEIEALRAEFSDASLQHDWDRFASLFTPDGAWVMPHIDVELVGQRTDPHRSRAAARHLVVLRAERAPGGDRARRRHCDRSAPTSRSSGASSTAARTSTTRCTTTAISAPRMDGGSRSAATRSATSTPRRSRARRRPSVSQWRNALVGCASMPGLLEAPEGPVTIMFTDIEGSTAHADAPGRRRSRSSLPSARRASSVSRSPPTRATTRRPPSATGSSPCSSRPAARSPVPSTSSGPSTGSIAIVRCR